LRIHNIHLDVEMELMEDAGKVSSQETFPAASDESYLQVTDIENTIHDML
jgi:hypothetical protein